MQIQSLKPVITSKDNVKSIVHYAHPTNEGKFIGRRYKQQEIYYNVNGAVVESISYQAGKIISWVKYAYDAQAQLVEIIHHKGNGYSKSMFTPFTQKMPSFQTTTTVLENRVLEFDKEGRKTESVFYKNGKIKQRKYFTKDGICLEEISYKKESPSVHIKYNEKGFPIERLTYSTFKKLEHHTTYEYDAAGNAIRIKDVQRNLIVHDRKLFYDCNNNLIDDIDIFKEEYKILNTDLNWKEHNIIGYRHKYFYNEKNLLIRHEMLLGDNLIMAYEFVYEFWE
jgi:hypothetical protein